MTGMDALETQTESREDQVSRLAEEAGRLGSEIVDVSGFLDHVAEQAARQQRVLAALTRDAHQLETSNRSVLESAESTSEAAGSARDALEAAVQFVATTGQRTEQVARWVADLSGGVGSLIETVAAVRKATADISNIAMQVNILAINASIEASRAGDAGRGFAVVAQAINELSEQTSEAARQSGESISALEAWIGTLRRDAGEVGETARAVLSDSGEAGALLEGVSRDVDSVAGATSRITAEARRIAELGDGLGGKLDTIVAGVEQTAQGVGDASTRATALIEIGESLVRRTTHLGAETDDTRFIEAARSIAARIGERFSQAVASGEITSADLFSDAYRPIPDTNPQQLMAPFTAFADRVLPEYQEPALELDPRVVFCAAVDRNGYLPTHNRVFSKPQGDDPDWNASNSRNRRLFDDRVGAKAGRNTEPFLLQVYRRDMGGGAFVMMKDLSVPIMVDGRHWGGLRLAYRL